MPGTAAAGKSGGLNRPGESDALWFGGLFAILLASRLCHAGVIWTEETLPLAAAQQVLDHGKTLYRDVWFDKPPLTALAYLLWGAETGWILRVAGALHAWLSCWVAYRLALSLWGRTEALAASGLLAFSLIFYLPSALIPLASDIWMLLPHLAAVWMAVEGRPLAAGALAGIAFLFNPKGLFIAAACVVFAPRSILPLSLGFVLPNALAFLWLWTSGALAAYWREVWQLGQYYAADTFVDAPVLNGVKRTANWLGFHAALVLLAVRFLLKRESRRVEFLLWGALAVVAICSGWRFFPRYFFQLLPVAVLAAGRGWSLAGRRTIALALVLLAVPLIRFGPRYATLAADLLRGTYPEWSDLAMDRDSRAAADRLRQLAAQQDTLFVWGYRPELYVYTGLAAGALYLESQPLNGVFADRHLFDANPSLPEHFTAEERARLAQSRPDWIVDGLTPLNPALAPQNFPPLQEWMEKYEKVEEAGGMWIYKRSAR